MSDGALSADEIDALLSGVNTSTVDYQSDDDLVGEDDPEFVKKMFSGFGRSSKQRDEKAKLYFEYVEIVMNDLVKLKKDIEFMNNLLVQASRDKPQVVKKFQLETIKILENTDKIIASGYEILLTEEKEKKNG
jgi:hypothetical protein